MMHGQQKIKTRNNQQIINQELPGKTADIFWKFCEGIVRQVEVG
jgi:hypothetical protein